ncbi:Dabb family protein [Alkalihalobacterium alkalinitrilicum]|uniref:Dabb family protein n=1 Tax=Alkalihalobacterium alkalinitrilicum TaxID=427920 RepID=UPI000995A753|nr:Dabb family protein [Alkalihalobacterium alkalinitrilicum]
MIEHIVGFKFNENTTSEQKAEIIKRAKTLKDDIPGIVSLAVGTNFSERSKGFELGLTVRFENREALEVYGPHPKHQELVSYLKEVGLTDILVLDFEIE